MNTDILLIFLLGGHDLEMIEIKDMLISQRIKFFDEKLHWNNAKLSAYKRILNTEDHFVGIELQSDIELPANYTLIDHHNEKSLSPSAIEQVAEMLKVQLTREQQLIAANDKGYIPAMEQMNATKEEIADIRKRDRIAQGITEEDEDLAKESIKRNFSTKKDTIIIKALTSKFSAITDFLYPDYKSLLIYTETELTYYGLNAGKLDRLFDKSSVSGSIYSGGGKNGYWGISEEEITNEIINQVLNLIKMEPFSKHIFLFPFKLKFGGEDLKEENLIKYLESKEWKKKEKENDSDVLYNEKKFFHVFVNPAIFAETETHAKIGKIRDSEIHKLEYLTPGFDYKIGIYKKEKEDNPESTLRKKPKENDKKPVFKKVEISLDLKKVTLDISKNIGVFAFHLEYYPVRNEKNDPELSDNVLLINQYGRRIFPPFYDGQYENFGEVEIWEEKIKKVRKLTSKLEGTKFREMPDYIEISDGISETPFADENWKTYTKPSDSISYIPKHILNFLGIGHGGKLYNLLTKESTYNLDLIPVLDDRMFVLCWMGAEQLTPEFKEKKLNRSEEQKKYGNILSGICERKTGGYAAGGFHRNTDNQKYLAINRSFDGYGFITNDYWYQFMFVDGLTKTCQNELLQQKLALAHSYDRWVEWYSLIGVTRYSFVMITAPLEELQKPKTNAAFLPENFTTIYFRMVSLVLLQRSMILDFSDEISRINFKSREKEKNEKNTKTDDKTFIEVRELYEDYRDFINKIYFREVTAQEQGIELYDMLQEHLRVEKQAKELEKEFDELHRLMNLLNEEEAKKLDSDLKKFEEEKQDRLKLIAMVISSVGILSLILSLLKAKEFDDLTKISEFQSSNLTCSLDACFLLIFVFVFAFYLIQILLVFYSDKKDKPKKVSIGWGIYCVAATLLVFTYFLIARQFSLNAYLLIVLGLSGIQPLVYIVKYFLKKKENNKSNKQ